MLENINHSTNWTSASRIRTYYRIYTAQLGYEEIRPRTGLVSAYDQSWRSMVCHGSSVHLSFKVRSMQQTFGAQKPSFLRIQASRFASFATCS